MTIQETHIYINQELQKINSYAVENFLPEEIDLLLNKFSRKFVDNVVGRLKPNEPAYFQHNQRLLDQIRTLLVKNHYISTEVSSEPNLVATIIPSNYKHLVSDASELVISANKATIEKKKYLYVLDFLATETLLPTFQLEVNGDVVFDISDYPAYVGGITDMDIKYQLVALMQDDVDNLYWESFAGMHFKNKFIFVSDTADVVRTIIDSTETTITAKEYTYKVYKDVVGEVAIRRPNRLHGDANLDFIRYHPFEKTVWESPISSMADKLFVYEGSDFKVKRVSIDYIRRPVQVSLAHNINSDLPEDTQDLIMEQVIVHIKGVIHDPSWQVAVQDNQLTNN